MCLRKKASHFRITSPTVKLWKCNQLKVICKLPLKVAAIYNYQLKNQVLEVEKSQNNLTSALNDLANSKVKIEMISESFKGTTLSILPPLVLQLQYSQLRLLLDTVLEWISCKGLATVT